MIVETIEPTPFPAAAVCDHYETRGVVLAEAGEYDSHLDHCVACRRLRDRHRVLAAAIGAVGTERRPPDHWQARVWACIEREEALARQRRSYAMTAAATMIAMAAAFVLWARTSVPASGAPSIEIVAGATAARSTSARVGDRIRVAADRDRSIWLYREDRNLIARCDAASPGPHCALGSGRLVLDAALSAPGRYQVVMVPLLAPAPEGNLDHDVAAVAGAGINYELTEVDVW